MLTVKTQRRIHQCRFIWPHRRYAARYVKFEEIGGGIGSAKKKDRRRSGTYLWGFKAFAPQELDSMADICLISRSYFERLVKVLRL